MTTLNAMTIEGIPQRSLEQDLVARHAWGDPEAFAEVYETHRTMVFNLALRLAGDPDDAADLTQEIFLRVHRHLRRFRGRSSLKTWIYRVALNHCRSRLGRRRRFLPLLIGSGEDERPLDLPDPAPGPEEKAVGNDRSRQLREALRRVPLTFREAVVLRDLEGLEYQEIADVLGIRLGTVRSRIARGRAHLREILAGEGA